MGIDFDGTVAVNVCDDWTDGPEAARICLSQEQIEKIDDVAKIAQANGLDEIRIFDYTPEFGFWDEDENFRRPESESEQMSARTDCTQMCVSQFRGIATVHWVAYIKHTSISVETTHLDVAKLVDGARQEGLRDG